MANDRPHSCRWDADGQPEVDQGLVYGNSVTWNPDDGLFYVHSGRDELKVLGRFADWRNAVQFAKKKAK